MTYIKIHRENRTFEIKKKNCTLGPFCFVAELEKYTTEDQCFLECVKGFLKSGAYHETDKPLWFDVWEAFPPAVPPTLDRPVPQSEVPQILYPEDAVRAKFYSKYERPLTSIKNGNPWKNIKAEVFVNEYIKRQDRNKTADQVMKEAITALQPRDVYFPTKLRRRYGEPDQVSEDDVKQALIPKRPTIRRASPKYSVDFSDLLQGDEEEQREITPDPAEVTLGNLEEGTSEIVKAKRTVKSEEDMESIIDNLIEKTDSGKVKFEDFYGKDDMDFEFEDEEHLDKKDKGEKK